MKKVRAFLILVGLITLSLVVVHPARSAGTHVGYVIPPAVGRAGTASIQFELLKQTVNVWSDGRGDLILDQRIHNLSLYGWDEMTWYFDWTDGTYSGIRAWDTAGPLDFDTRMEGSRIYVTIHFRDVVPINQTYSYGLAITIAGMAESETADEWRANWWTGTGNASVSEFVEAVTLPSNASILSATPQPTTQRGNYIEWRFTNTPSGHVFEIDVLYRLSDTIAVPLFLQKNNVVATPAAPWAGDTYGNYQAGDTYNTISRWGCKMVSAAMIINYWAEQNQLAFRTTPRDLNNWFRSHSGYDRNNGVIDAQVVAYAQENGIPLANPGYHGSRNDPVLDDYLRSGNPVILGVPGHFVVATGKTTVNGVETYAINDPVYGQTTLYDHYNNTYSSVRLYMGTPTEMRSLRISAHSPVELVITDPQGRKIGYDPSTGQTWDEIPGADYFVERIAANADPAQGEWIESKMVMIYAPLDGPYTVEVHGTGQGAYEINAFAADWQGQVTSQVETGQAQVGSMDEIEVDYSSEDGLPDTNSYLYLPTVIR